MTQKSFRDELLKSWHRNGPQLMLVYSIIFILTYVSTLVVFLFWWWLK
jgi:hypothetical protein